MATKDDGMVRIQLRNPEGDVVLCDMPADLAAMLKRSDCDPDLRSQVLETVFKSSKHGKSSNQPDCSNSESSEVEPPYLASPIGSATHMKPTSIEPATPYVESTQKIHNWTEIEELLLIDVRRSMDEKFQESKFHDTLWLDIKKRLEVKGVLLSTAQIMNKWKNLKKRYKEIVDINSKTGGKTTNWKHYDKFNQLYGNKASTRIEATFDSTGGSFVKENKLVSECSTPTTKKKAAKRKATDILQSVEQLQHTAQETLEEMKDHNKNQLNRLDRFLDIYERSVNAKAQD